MPGPSELSQLAEELCQSLERRLPTRSVVVFGSVARGDFSTGSDFDFIVVSDGFPERYFARFDVIRPALMELKRSETYRRLKTLGHRFTFSPIPYRPEDLADTSPLLLDVVEDGILLRDDGTMKRKLAEVRERIQELGAKRVRTYKGHHYWVLKADFKPGETIQI